MAKLSSIYSRAALSTVATTGAYSDLSGLPTLGTAAATASIDYATAAQGALADTALQPTETETVSGNYTFNGALYLPNNSRINNIEHFYQTTKPTTRGDSSALVAGDKWYKTDDGTEWFWNGTYWLSCQQFNGGGQVNGISSTTNVPSVNSDQVSAPVGYALFIEDLTVHYNCPTADVSNYWAVGVRLRYCESGGITGYVDYSIDLTTATPTFVYSTITTTFNTILTETLVYHAAIVALKVNSPDILRCVASLNFRTVHP